MDYPSARIAESIIGAAIEIHRTLGPGLLESAYEKCLSREFELRDIPFQSQVALPVSYKGSEIDCGYRMDMVVNSEVVVELQAVESVLPIHKAQLLTYLKLSGLKTGLLLNFHTPLMKDGIVRVVL